MKAQAIAYQKFIHEAPRKLRLIADAIRGQKVDAALITLKFSTKHASNTMEKILTQAKSNAQSVHHTAADSLIVKTVVVEEGPRIKRWRPVARGMAHSIIKRTSHVKIVVEGVKNEATKKAVAVKPAKPAKPTPPAAAKKEVTTKKVEKKAKGK